MASEELSLEIKQKLDTWILLVLVIEKLLQLLYPKDYITIANGILQIDFSSAANEDYKVALLKEPDANCMHVNEQFGNVIA